MVTYKKSSAVLFIHESKPLKILGVTRKDDPNDWGLPGGKADGKETYWDCAVREAYEETGLHLVSGIPVYCGVVKDGVYKCTTYLATSYYGTPRSEPGTDSITAWITLHEILTGSFGDYNLRLVEELLATYMGL